MCDAPSHLLLHLSLHESLQHTTVARGIHGAPGSCVELLCTHLLLCLLKPHQLSFYECLQHANRSPVHLEKLEPFPDSSFYSGGFYSVMQGLGGEMACGQATSPTAPLQWTVLPLAP